jgi:hypothetical protein
MLHVSEGNAYIAADGEEFGVLETSVHKIHGKQWEGVINSSFVPVVGNSLETQREPDYPHICAGSHVLHIPSDK